jgi:4-amino-4-deoxy-L-arabinose transferase-like glycosyltransferase
LWGGWLAVTGAAFSLGQGIIHPYYTIALAPAIGAIVGIGAVTLWQRNTLVARYTLTAAFAATVVWSFVLLDRTTAWHPWLRSALLIAGFGVGAAMLAWPLLSRGWARAVLAAAVCIGLLGPGAYTLATAATPHSGAIPSAGPAVAGGAGPGGAGGFARTGGFNGARNGLKVGNGFNGPPAGTGGRAFGGLPGIGTGGAPAAGGAGGRTGGLGGLLGGTTVSSSLKTLLLANSTRYTWVAATVDANNAASYELATGASVMAIGGFNGTDPSPTLAQFQRDVAAHEIHYFIAGGGGFGGGGAAGGGQTSSTATAITAWVTSTFTAKTVGGVTVYDLTTSSRS